jgi:uncharacterized membrane protein (DUF485 family)
MKSILRRLRGTVGNALLWAGAWFLAAFPVTAVLPSIIDVLPNFTYLGALTFLAPTLAVMGFVSGGAFSLYLGIAGRDRRINELNPGKVAFGTGVTVSLLMLVFLVLFVALRGFPVVWVPALLASAITGGIAGATALGQVKIAQKSLSPGEGDRPELEPGVERSLPDPEGDTVGHSSPSHGEA